MIILKNLLHFLDFLLILCTDILQLIYFKSSNLDSITDKIHIQAAFCQAVKNQLATGPINKTQQNLPNLKVDYCTVSLILVFYKRWHLFP